MLALGYPADEQYLNGHLVAEKLNINLTPCIEKWKPPVNKAGGIVIFSSFQSFF